MRIVQAHKFFYPHAGTETVLFHTRELLRERGHTVIDFSMAHPANLASPYSTYFAPRRDYFDRSRSRPRRGLDALSTVYSPTARRCFSRLIEDTRPDLIHMHSVYHQLTLSVVDEAARQGIPIVMTLHDYKIGCPAYSLNRNGQPCELCVEGAAEHAIRHRCLKGSLAASLLAAGETRLARERGTYGKVDAFVSPSAFVAEMAVATGIDPTRVHVVPNFLPLAELSTPVEALAPDPSFFFAGRLEATKGVEEMLSAFAGGDPALGTLVLAGAGGSLEDKVRAAASTHPNIEYLGRLSRAAVLARLRRSRALLMPVRSHENNPMSVLEARAAGVPVICTGMGGLPDMVDNGRDGLLIPREDPAALAAAVRRLTADRGLAEKMGRQGNRRLLRDNVPDTHYRRLLEVYETAQVSRAR